MNIFEQLKDPYFFFALLSVVNVLFYIFTYLFSSYWGCSRKQVLKPKSFGDFTVSLLVLVTNIAVAIPGYLLFYYDVIVFDYAYSFFLIFVELMALLFIIDFIMYVTHRLSHEISFLKVLHKKHHTHKEFNELSLYVMNPLEAIGLGLLFTFLFYLYSFNIYAVIIFLLINWFWGVIAHFNVDKVSVPTFLSNNLFHAIHHKEGEYNLGFYTVIWDKLFGTFKARMFQAKKLNDKEGS